MFEDDLKSPCRLREGQRDLGAQRPSRSGMGFHARRLELAHPQPLPQAGGEQ
jgi:hypothetical protein